MAADRLAVELLASWQGNVQKFAWDNFRVDLEPWQVDVAAVATSAPKVRVGMQAAVGVGKSTELAILGWHFISTNGDQSKHRGKFPNGYALSISGDNLKSGLWKELGVWYERSDFLRSQFDYTAEQVTHRNHPLNWWLRARKYAKSANPESQGATLSGLHSPWALVLLDEVGEMHPQVGRRAEQVLSDADCERGLIAAAYNPTSTTGLGYDIASQGSGWTIVQVTGDPDDPNRSRRVDLEWAQEQIRKYGRDNPWVMAHILGKFPPGGINTLLSPDEVRAAMERNPSPDSYEWSQKRLGIDVARFGDDRTVIFPRQGLAAFRPHVMRNADTNAIAARAAAIALDWGSELELIDDTGHWGHGVYDQLRASGRSPIPIQFHAPAGDPRYRNRRAEGWLKMADAIKQKLALPLMPELIPELTGITYSFDGGKFALEDKDMVKKRLGFSPDLADALAITYMMPDAPAAGTDLARVIQNRQAFVQSDYHPHKRR